MALPGTSDYLRWLYALSVSNDIKNLECQIKERHKLMMKHVVNYGYTEVSDAFEAEIAELEQQVDHLYLDLQSYGYADLVD